MRDLDGLGWSMSRSRQGKMVGVIHVVNVAKLFWEVGLLSVTGRGPHKLLGAEDLTHALRSYLEK